MFIRQCLVTLLAAFSFAAFAGVDVNKASQAELEAVRGVGTSLSARILDERKKGEFKSWDDMIQRVRGVGPGSAAKLSQAGLTVGTASFKPEQKSPEQAAAKKAPKKAST